MGGNDEFEDQTMGGPRPRPSTSGPRKIPGWPAAPGSTRPAAEERPTPVPGPVLPPAPPSRPMTAGDELDTLLPPQAAPAPRARPPKASAPAPTAPGPIRDAFGTELDAAPRALETHWPGLAPAQPSGPINPGWDDPSPAVPPAAEPPSWPGEGPETLPPAHKPRTPPPRHERPRPEVRTPAEFLSEAPSTVRPSRGPISAPADDFRTIGIGSGLEIGSPEKAFVLQYAVGKRPWRDLETIEPDWHPVGRSSFRQAGPAAEFLAEDHFHVIAEDDRIYVEPGETINGIYLKLEKRRPFELASGTRFQVAQHVIEFRGPETSDEPGGTMQSHGESFRTSRLEPLGYLDFLGPDGAPTASYPMTKPEGTLIGRNGDIVLPEASGVSRTHARVYRQGDRFFLEDLESTNGTFVRLARRVRIKAGGALDALSGDVLLIGAVFVRVVES